MKSNGEILRYIFGEELPHLAAEERDAAERVINWLKECPGVIDSRNTPEKVAKIVTAADGALMEIYGIHLAELEGKGRRRPFVDYRMWCMIEMSARGRLTQYEVAKIMGRRRAVISNSKTTVQNLCSVDKNYRAEHDRFVEKLNQKLLCDTSMSLCR